MNKPLITLAIVSYNNYKYIKEALESVFTQEYPNIQLIISNDGSSDFDEEELILYLNEKRTDNIKQIIINNNERNIGTVKNVKYCRDNSDGEFIMYMAADDTLYDEHVLSRYEEEFQKLGEDAMIVCSKTAMCGHALNDVIDYFPNQEYIDMIKNYDSKQLFSKLSHKFIIPTTSSCYRKSLFEIIGDYSEEYFIIEDAPLYLRMARMGIKFNWVDNHIGARHRDGGISHGNTLNLSEAYRKYRYDEILIYEKEILPYKEQLLRDDYKKMMKKWDYIQNSYFQLFVLPNLKGVSKAKYMLGHLPFILIRILKRGKNKAIELSYDEHFCRDLGKTIIYFGIFFFMLMSNLIYPIISDRINYFLIKTTGYIFVSLMLTFLMLYFLRFVYRIYLSAKYILLNK